ncbi:unnamed protein product, partial [Ascophyllum nodosum]
MIDVKSGNQCRIEGCGKVLSVGVGGTKTAECCLQHAPDGMVDACSRKCRTGGCDMYPSFAVTNTRTTEYCAQHARLECGVEGYIGRKFDPHHFGKEAIGNIIPSSVKHKTVNPPPTKTNP